MTEQDECQLCIEDRVKANLNPWRLVVLKEVTKLKRLPVRVCPDCDGGVLQIEKGSSDV